MHRVREGVCGFYKVIWMKEFGPTAMQEILKSHADIVQSLLIELCLLAIGSQ
jgi:hypothetical protein